MASLSKSRRLMLSACLALPAAVLGTGLSEFALTMPQVSTARLAIAQNQPLATAENAVVYIETELGRGSGVILASDGLIVTNAHVVEGARQVTVTLQGRAVPAEVVALGHPNCLDLALIKVSNQSNLPVIPLGDISQVYKTEPVFAIGYPGPLPSSSATITNGIVSNLYSRDGLIQFDGPINGGNSGGAVVNGEGKLVGIATSKIEGSHGRVVEGMSFAIAVDKVLTFVESYRRGDPAVIGYSIMPGSNPDQGSLVQSLTLDGQVASGVLQPGDSAFCGDSTLADVYTFEAESGQGIMLAMASQAMGIYLVLVSPTGEVVARSGQEEPNQAAIILEKLPTTGTYTVIANALRPDQAGPYQLRATELLLVERGAIDSRTRPCFEGGQRCQTYAFQAQAGQPITVMIHNAEFESFLALLDASGEAVAPEQSDYASMSFVLPTAGWYTLVVSNTEPDATGSFMVSVHDTATLISAQAISQR